MKIVKWQVVLAGILLFLSALSYFFNYLVVHDLRHIVDYFFIDLGFVPIEVLLVTLVIERLLKFQERRLIDKKMSMVRGAFYSQVGMRLMKFFLQPYVSAGNLKNELIVRPEWNNKDYAKAIKAAQEFFFSIDARKGDLVQVRDFLKEERGFLLRLLENPNVLEHGLFAELLWAVFHLAEELCARERLQDLPGSDYEHLGNDIKRAYGHLIIGWLMHMRHLSKEYPYLFSLAVRTNPFDDNASVVITR